MSVTTGSSSHSASTCASASSAWSRVSATIAATASPCQHARSIAIAYCGARLDALEVREHRDPRRAVLGHRAPVEARDHAGLARRLGQIERLDAACAYGLRKKTTCARRGKRRSSTKVPRPCEQALRVGARNALPDVALVGLRAGRVQRKFGAGVHRFAPPCAFSSTSSHRVDDRVVTGAAAVVAGHVLADLVARGLRPGADADPAPPSACPGVQKPHCSALCSWNAFCSVGELARVRQPLDGVDRAAVGLHREHEAAAHDLAVDANGAGAADAVLAADVRAGEADGRRAGNRSGAAAPARGA